MRVTRIVAAANRDPDDPRRRYHIGRAAYEEVEALCARTGLWILGLYHSHPDARPDPSPRDAEYAFPGWIYWISAVREEGRGPARAWRRRLDTPGWEELKIEINDEPSQSS